MALGVGLQAGDDVVEADLVGLAQDAAAEGGEAEAEDDPGGRKNYLFAGSHDAARRTANPYSLTRTCAQCGIPPLAYFTDVLGKLAAGWAVDRLDELLPHRWRLPEMPARGAPGP